MPRIEIYDTTLRDGAQGEGVSFSLQDKLALTERLDRLGFDFVEGGYPASNDKDCEYFKRVGELNLKHAKVCAFGMTRRKHSHVESDAGLQALLDAETAIITLVGKASAFQATDVLRTTSRRKSGDDRRERRLSCRPRAARCSSTPSTSSTAGKQDADYALLAAQTAVEAGAAAVMLCDTNGGSMTDEIAAGTAAAVARLCRAARHPLP